MKAFSIIYFLCIAFVLQACNDNSKSPGEQLSQKYCGSCHLYPEPSLLDKRIWTESILPKMSSKLGIQLYDGKYVAALSPNNQATNGAAVSFSDWMNIVDFYSKMAPEKMPSQDRQPINEFTNLFEVKEPGLQEGDPSTTYIKIDAGNQFIYAGSAYDSSFAAFDSKLKLIQRQQIGKITVDLDFNEPLNLTGQRSGLLTNIGSFYPTDERIGSIHSFEISDDGKFKVSGELADSLPRPVQTTRFVVHGSKNDLIVCGFGHESGALYYLYRNKSEALYRKKILSQLAGAVKVIVEDYNKDGLPDIIVLFAQDNEGIYLFTNTGNGDFKKTTLLRFPPVYGSTYFEMQDVNGDGAKDIIYTCGDNYDYSRVLKNYHGIYIFINHPGKGFKQEYFFPMNGCYKAIGRDFDKDGDIDIAAISFFPDLKSQPQESFVLLNNIGDLKFSPSGIRQNNRGNWITMDAADVDGDGDEDIVIGSLLLKIPNTTVPLLTKKNAPAFLLLLNQTR